MIRPRLRHCTLIQQDEHAPLEVVIGRDRFEISEEAGSRTAFLTLKRYLDGRHSLPEISQRSGVRIEDVEIIVEEFRRCGFLQERGELAAIPVADFLERVDASAAMWKRQIGFNRLFALLETGAARREVLIGLLIETWHYVKSASWHIANALAHCDDAYWRSLLRGYLEDEAGHGAGLVGAIESCGLSREAILGAHPLIGTLSLQNMLNEIGRHSTLAYFTCTTLFEAAGDGSAAAAEHLRRIGAVYGLEEAVEAFVDHMQADINARHGSLLSQALHHRETVNAQAAHEAINYMHDLKHSFDQFYNDILAYYSDISNYIPRLKVDYFAL